MSRYEEFHRGRFGKEFEPTTYMGYKNSAYSYGSALSLNTKAGSRIDKSGYRDYSSGANSNAQDEADLYERGGRMAEHFSNQSSFLGNRTHIQARFVPSKLSISKN